MSKNLPEILERKFSWGIGGAVISAIAASICCVGPLVLLALGVSGAWIGNLTTLEPYRPIFLTITLVFLGFAFYSIYRKPKTESCAVEKPCASPGTKRMYKAILWIITILIFWLLIFPYLVPYVFAGSQTDEKTPTEQVVLVVRNMTCATCTVVVRKSLTKLEGVKDVKVTLNPPEAVVVLYPEKIKIEDLIKATSNAGFPSSVKQ